MTVYFRLGTHLKCAETVTFILLWSILILLNRKKGLFIIRTRFVGRNLKSSQKIPLS